MKKNILIIILFMGFSLYFLANRTRVSEIETYKNQTMEQEKVIASLKEKPNLILKTDLNKDGQEDKVQVQDDVLGEKILIVEMSGKNPSTYQYLIHQSGLLEPTQ